MQAWRVTLAHSCKHGSHGALPSPTLFRAGLSGTWGPDNQMVQVRRLWGGVEWGASVWPGDSTHTLR